VAVTLAWTGFASVLVRVAPARLLTWSVLGIELAIAMALVFADWWVYGRVGGTWSSHGQSLGVAWPAAAVLSIGVACGATTGFAAGAALGLARLAGQLVFWTDPTDPPLNHGDNQLSAVGTIVMYALAGGIAGLITTKLRTAEREVAVARAREEVARTLHDGVLQTLAVVQRRSTDPELGALAREQEVELRQYLFDVRPEAARGKRGTADLAASLRDTAANIERRQSRRTDVVLTDDVEVLTQVGPHAAAPDRVVVAQHDAHGAEVAHAQSSHLHRFDPGRSLRPAPVRRGSGCAPRCPDRGDRRPRRSRRSR
jgi:signal transduction histidine kinase